MKPVNILSVCNCIGNSVFDSYTKYLGIQFKDVEKECLPLLVQNISNCNPNISVYDNFYFGYEIPQISKEFDLLRIGNTIINIEIKSETDLGDIRNQLFRNKYYLSYLDKPMYLFSFAADTGLLYKLNDGDELEVVNFNELINLLVIQQDLYVGNPDHLFDPSNYLVSPFNSTEDFINGKYFLTLQQEIIIKDINGLLVSPIDKIAVIKGGAGTGKTLLLYDCAKQLMQQGKNVVIVHVGRLNQGHEKLKEVHGFNIVGMYNFENQTMRDENVDFDMIFIDESQRLSDAQVKKIIDFTKKRTAKCVFCLDPKQTLSDDEKNSNAVNLILNDATVKFSLSNKFRTNKELVGFIKSMFDLRNGSIGKNDNISVVYFDDWDTALKYISNKPEYSFIGYTPSQIYPHSINALKYLPTSKGVAHEIIGQEFDNVSVLIDAAFSYDRNGRLICSKRHGNPYDELGMFYQNVTRARKKLEIVVFNNPDVFEKILNILT